MKKNFPWAWAMYFLQRYWLPVLVLLNPLAMMACAPVGPDYIPPVYQAEENWNTALGEGLTPTPVLPDELSHWWANFNDPILSSLVDRAVAGNLDLQQAYARLREARTRLGISRAGEFPTVDASGSASRNYTNQEGQNLFQVGFDAGWELDIFGGVRRSLEAADADLGASREDLRDVLISLLGEVASNYIEVRTLQVRLETAAQNIKAQENTYQLTSWRYQAGLSDELAVQQSRYNLASARAQLPGLRTSLEASLNRLAVLVGEEPGQIHQLLEKSAPIPAPPVTVAVGVPAETLRQRPDLRRAERQLAAATARIGVATADLYPKFRLNGSIGLNAVDTADIFAAESRSYRFGPAFSWSLVDGGQIRSNIEVQSALQEQKLYQYQRVLLSALEEVENALSSYAEEQQRYRSLQEAAQAAAVAAGLARDKYQAGLQDFSTVLDAQRSQLSLEDQLAQSRGAISTDLVRLYKALGGGWQTLAADLDAAQPENKEPQHE